MLRKLPRVILDVLAALSLLLCVAACVLWVRSYWRADVLWRGEGRVLRSSPGALRYTDYRPDDADGRPGIATLIDGDPPWMVVTVPYPVPAAAAALAPAAWLAARLARRTRGRRRRRLGRCAACGYDLRATPGRCPECGIVPAAIGTAA